MNVSVNDCIVVARSRDSYERVDKEREILGDRDRIAKNMAVNIS